MGGSCGPTGSTIAPAVKQVFWGFPPFLALVETIALAVHFLDMDVVGQAVEEKRADIDILAAGGDLLGDVRSGTAGWTPWLAPIEWSSVNVSA